MEIRDKNGNVKVTLGNRKLVIFDGEIHYPEG